jgi:hypothetical protein
MINNRLLCLGCTAIILFWLIACNNYAEASGTGFTTFGSPLPLINGEITSRQQISFNADESLLIGRLSHGPVRLVVLEAPGCQTASAILRKTVMPDGSQLLFLSIPDDVVKKVISTKLFLERAPDNQILAEYQPGEWIIHEPQKLSIYDKHIIDGITNDLYVFQVTTLGPFYIYPKGDYGIASSGVNKKFLQSAITGGSALRGFWNIVLPVLFMALAFAISKLIHSVRQRLEDHK